MLAYKFTRRGGIGPFTGFPWPLPSALGPGAWVEPVAVRPCRVGIHACRPAQLPHWIGPELWVIELDGDVTELPAKLVARRGRLLGGVDAWTGGGAEAFGRDCAVQARDLVVELLAAAGRPEETADLATRTDLGQICTRARDLARRSSGLVELVAGYAADAAHFAEAGEPAVAGHCAATAAGDLASGGRGHDAASPGFVTERARQADWMVEHLGLVP